MLPENTNQDNKVKAKTAPKETSQLAKLIDSLQKDRATQMIGGGVIVVIVLIAIFVPSMFDEPKGTWKYGVCKAFIEGYIAYPSSADVLVAAEREKSAIIYISKRNAFGDETLQLYDCGYERSEAGRMILKQVLVNDIPVSPENLEAFSKAIPSIMSTEMDLRLPQGFSLNIEKFKDRPDMPLDPVYNYSN